MLLKFAYEDFIADRKLKNLSKSTIIGYQYVVRPFVENPLPGLIELDFDIFRQKIVNEI